MNNDWDGLLADLAGKGTRAKIAPLGRLADLRETIDGLHRRKLIDDDLYEEEELAGFSFEPPADMESPLSLIIAAVPVPQTRLTFVWDGRPFPAMLPPTYVRYRPMMKSVQDEIAASAARLGHRAAPAWIPLKSLAVACGLGFYGKNNLSYIPGLGSFYQLVGCFSTIAAPVDEWPGPRMLPRCERCSACLNACPTGAIRADRFLISAERCLVFHNERDRDFPGWIDPSWHHTLVGCLKCQVVCPENRPFRNWIVPGESFDEEETRLLLGGPSLDEMPPETRAKVRRLGLTASWKILSRNLAAILPSRPSAV